MPRSAAMNFSAAVISELSYCSKNSASDTSPSSETRLGATSGTPPRKGGIHHGLRSAERNSDMRERR
jgi:hypothetical protein